VTRNGRAQIDTVTDLPTLTRLEPEWNALWTRCPSATPFQRPEWLICWIEAFPPAELWTLTVRDAGQLVAISPLYIQQKGTERTLAPVGAAISDYLDWLIDPAASSNIARLIIEHITNRESSWSCFDFSDLPASSPLLDLKLGDDWEGEPRFHDSCPVLQLPQKVEELRNIIPRRQLRSVKNARKKLEKAGGVQVEVATPETLDELLAALFRLHRTRWSQFGSTGTMLDDAVRQFHRRVAPLLLEKGVLRVYALRFENRIIASLYALFESNTAYCYLQGFDPHFAEYSPGAQILAAVIEDAVKLEKRSIDFLRGREAYKYAWGARDTPTFRLRARKRLRDLPQIAA
jgi:CelD/BcsL family acetyltransferase involved in cellulose biosynthesis